VRLTTLHHLAAALIVVFSAVPDAAAQRKTEYVVLVTLDGVRTREIFGGLDRDVLASTLKNPAETPVESHPAFQKFWAPTPEARRQKLMPFFWGTLMNQGSIAGNVALGSSARVTNGHHFSYPGYSEILTGQAHDDVIKSNAAVQSPFETVLEFVRNRLRLAKDRVAVFASWATIGQIAERVPGSLATNAGVQRWESKDPLIAQLNDLQAEIPSPWEIVRPDAFTFRLAMAHLKSRRPTVLYIALDETDDWAHDGKYDLVLQALQRTDRYLQELWTWLQADPQYRGRTSLVITTDHGRGTTVDDWRSHGATVAGADEIWIAVASPDSALRGEWRGAEPVFQDQIAATLAKLLGLDWNGTQPGAGSPLNRIWSAQTP
jgi:hypothetical protein